MKKRVFYVINLDRGRIWILATLLVSTLLFAFATGFRVGASQSGSDGELSQASPNRMQLAELGPTTGSPDSADANGETEERADAAGRSDFEDAGASPFEKNPNDRYDSDRDAYDTRRGVMDSSLNRDSRGSTQGRNIARAKSSNDTKRNTRAITQKSGSTVQKKDKATAAKRKSSSKQVAARKQSKKQSKKRSSTQSRKASGRKTVASKKSTSGQKNTAKKATASHGENPRSALLDTDSGALRMANISKRDPGTKTKTTDTKAAADQRAKKQSGKIYSLQLGAFSSRAASDRMAATLKKQGFHPYIVESRGKFIVRVGKSDTAKGLWKLETGLRKKQYAPMRVSSPSRR